MTSTPNTPKTVSPTEARRMMAEGAKLVDIRGTDEFARARAQGAENRPLDQIERIDCDGPIVFMCRSGMRTGSNAQRLAACHDGEAFLLEGGLEAWRKAGLPVEEDRSQPLELMRQGQIAAGSLGLIGVAELFGADGDSALPATLISMIAIAFGVQAGLVLWQLVRRRRQRH